MRIKRSLSAQLLLPTTTTTSLTLIEFSSTFLQWKQYLKLSSFLDLCAVDVVAPVVAADMRVVGKLKSSCHLEFGLVNTDHLALNDPS